MNNTNRLLAASLALAALVVPVVPVICLAGGPLKTMEFEPVEAACISGQTGTAADSRILLAFDLSGLPEKANIQCARLRVTDQAGIVWNAPFVPVLAGALTKAWDASTASWYNASGGQTWDSPGGDWDPEHTTYKVIVHKARAPAGLLLTDIATKWVNGGLANYGVIVMIAEAEELADVAPYFNSQFLKPVLRVRYLLPEEGP